MYKLFVFLIALCVGGLALYLAVSLLKRFNWFFAWLRGSAGLIFLALAIVVALAAWDLGNYQELLDEKPIASIRFTKQGDQLYSADITYYIEKDAQSFEIHGDQWQVDARIIRWTGIISAVGAKPGFRLDRISGRYYSLEDERLKARSVFNLTEEKPILDLWSIMQNHGDFIPGIDAVYGSAAYLPMADAATFQLSLSHNGLTAEPVNEVAKSAVKRWK